LWFTTSSLLFIDLAKSLDFGSAHQLIKSVVDQITELRTDTDFSNLFHKITAFGIENNIDLNAPTKQRQRKISSRLADSLVTGTLGQRDEIRNETQYRTRIHYPVIDSILTEINTRFSADNMEILRGISSLSPESPTFLDINELKSLCQFVRCDISLAVNEIQVLKPMVKDSKAKNIVDLFIELRPFAQAFPTIHTMIIGAMTIPVSSCTTERSFSKMKLIKTNARNSMSDGRLSDLSLLSIERDFLIDYDKIIDSFAAQHKNSRILLK